MEKRPTHVSETVKRGVKKGTDTRQNPPSAEIACGTTAVAHIL